MTTTMLSEFTFTKTTDVNNWYIYNGIKGVLAWEDSEKFAGVKPIETFMGVAFYSLESISGRNITDEDCLVEYYDSYEPSGEPCNIHEEIVCELVVNIECYQSLIYTLVCKKMYEQDLYDREMKTETDRYYEWRSELTKYIDYVLVKWRREMESLLLRGEDEDMALDIIKNEMEDKWNEVSAPYAAYNHEDNAQTFDNVWSIISEKVSNLR